MKIPFTLATSFVALAAAAAVAWPVSAAAAGDKPGPTREQVKAQVIAESSRGMAQPGGEQMIDPREPVAASAPRARADVKREVLQAAARGELIPPGEGRPTDGWDASPSAPSPLYARRPGR